VLPWLAEDGGTEPVGGLDAGALAEVPASWAIEKPRGAGLWVGPTPEGVLQPLSTRAATAEERVARTPNLRGISWIIGLPAMEVEGPDYS